MPRNKQTPPPTATNSKIGRMLLREEGRGVLKDLYSVPAQNQGRGPDQGKCHGTGTGIGRPVIRPTKQNIAQVLKTQGVDKIKVVDKITRRSSENQYQIQGLRHVTDLLPRVADPTDFLGFNAEWTRSQQSHPVVCTGTK